MAKETRINGSSGEQVRVYAPSEGMLAYREEFYRSAQLVSSQPRRRPVRETAPEPAARPQRESQRRENRIFEPLPVLKMMRQNRFFVKLAFVVSLATVAAFCLMVTLRFANIMAVQYDINKLRPASIRPTSGQMGFFHGKAAPPEVLNEKVKGILPL